MFFNKSLGQCLLVPIKIILTILRQISKDMNFALHLPKVHYNTNNLQINFMRMGPWSTKISQIMRGQITSLRIRKIQLQGVKRPYQSKTINKIKKEEMVTQLPQTPPETSNIQSSLSWNQRVPFIRSFWSGFKRIKSSAKFGHLTLYVSIFCTSETA